VQHRTVPGLRWLQRLIESEPGIQNSLEPNLFAVFVDRLSAARGNGNVEANEIIERLSHMLSLLDPKEPGPEQLGRPQ
jgi:hypothetical protein